MMGFHRADLLYVEVIDGDLASAIKRFGYKWKSSYIGKQLASRCENPRPQDRRKAKNRRALKRFRRMMARYV